MKVSCDYRSSGSLNYLSRQLLAGAGRVFPENYSTTNSQAKTIYGGRDGRGIAATAREIEAARPRE